MSLSERRRQFETASKADPLVTPNTKFHKMLGVSNSAKVIGRGLQLGVANLNTVRANVDSFALACVMVFPPADEVYFTVYVRSGAPRMIARLAEMKRLGTGAQPAGEEPAEEDSSEEDTAEESGGGIAYAARNNLVVVVLADDGGLYLRNRGFWDELPTDMTPFGAPILVDKINIAIYPPAASVRRSLLAREFVGYLGSLTGHEKIHELRVWTDSASVSPEMQRMPEAIPIREIETAITAAGGHYPGGEVRRFHAGLNFLKHKHFVILSGLSGTGKTLLAQLYARAVHGLTDATVQDPFLFNCAVRPEWTDPTGLTGYYDVLSNRYVVPQFLEAILLATAYPDSPVFVVLDEMNLARVEYYLSDVLSAIETKDALNLHSNNVPHEGTTGTSIQAELPLPPNLYITGTVNVDESSTCISDKVLDRAIVIDMSVVDLAGFLADLEAREPALRNARAACEDHLLAVHTLMTRYGLGFGYRVAEEVVRYHAFAADHLHTAPTATTDDLMVQKVLVKLRGTEKQRPLLKGLSTALADLPRSLAFIDRLTADLTDFGSFQASR
jgi:5-methylcytosine-specific restriction protein B